MRLGIAADHGGFELKRILKEDLEAEGWQIKDFGAREFLPGDDYPDFVLPLARAVSREIDRGLAICGSGVGACIAANRVPGARACLIHDIYSAHQGVEDDNMNIMCLGGRVIASSLAWDLVQTFLKASYSKDPRFERRLAKIPYL
ncbi:MAG: RpiB/LacA/LacB family sugar-phosphate isomerase [Desulfurivibrionaceae bacterium]